MSKTMKIRIPVLVGSNGRWCANGYTAESPNTDWAFMEETVCDPIGATDADINANLLRVWVEVQVPVPSEPVVQGTAILEGGAK